MIAEYIRISMGIGELAAMCFVSGLVGGTVAMWLHRKAR